MSIVDKASGSRGVEGNDQLSCYKGQLGWKKGAMILNMPHIIWKAHCKAMFEHLRPNPLEVLHGAGEAWSEFFQNEVCPRINNRVGRDEGVVSPGLTWCAPPNPFLKLNTTTGSVEIAEAQAIIEGLSFALENGITHDLKSKFSVVRWTWIPREANVVVDAAAAIAVGGMATEVWVN
ncbi:hypothetical protein GBA52_020070 [Prunus armeniaca]|nr:hypothetical protein GBA52_020070 [Prunus armeniaca]